MFKSGYLRSDRLKKGKLGHKLPLTREGHRYIEARGADIMAVIDDLGVVLPKKIDYEDKNLNKYFFSSDGQRPYSRVFFTAKVNSLLRSVPELREFGTCPHEPRLSLWLYISILAEKWRRRTCERGNRSRAIGDHCTVYKAFKFR